VQDQGESKIETAFSAKLSQKNHATLILHLALL